MPDSRHSWRGCNLILKLGAPVQQICQFNLQICQQGKVIIFCTSGSVVSRSNILGVLKCILDHGSSTQLKTNNKQSLPFLGGHVFALLCERASQSANTRAWARCRPSLLFLTLFFDTNYVGE